MRSLKEGTAMQDDSWLSLKGKTAVVTGAHRGLGQAISKALKAKGAKVIGFDIAVEHQFPDKTDFLKELESNSLVYLKVDVSEESSVKRAIDFLLCSEIHVDILVNNAGVSIK